MVTYEQALANPQEFLGRDISLNPRDDIKIGASDDYAIVMGSATLTQAIINRLRTAQGELPLHPLYGSRLPEILGAVPNEQSLMLARMYIRDALLQEPRISSIDSIALSWGDDLKMILNINIKVTPIQENDPLNIVFSIFLTGQGTLQTQVK